MSCGLWGAALPVANTTQSYVRRRASRKPWTLRICLDRHQARHTPVHISKPHRTSTGGPCRLAPAARQPSPGSVGGQQHGRLVPVRVGVPAHRRHPSQSTSLRRTFCAPRDLRTCAAPPRASAAGGPYRMVYPPALRVRRPSRPVRHHLAHHGCPPQSGSGTVCLRNVWGHTPITIQSTSPGTGLWFAATPQHSN